MTPHRRKNDLKPSDLYELNDMHLLDGGVDLTPQKKYLVAAAAVGFALIILSVGAIIVAVGVLIQKCGG